MATRVPKVFAQTVDTHRARLVHLVSKKNLSGMKQLYDAAQARLTKHLARVIKASRGDTFQAHQMRVLKAQVQQGQAVIAHRMAGRLGDISKQAQEASIKGLVADVSRLSKHFTDAEVVLPLDEAARLAGLVDKRRSSLMRQHKTSMARYGASIVQEVEQSMAISLMTGESSAAVIENVDEVVGGAWWQAESIVRTETAFAFNASHFDGLKEAAEELPELMQRWEENCDDEGNPMDDRVAVDSLAMHGQVVAPGGLFTMPSMSEVADVKGRFKVPRHLVGEQWPFPPCRPNDRAVLSPWMPDWGVPGWRYEDDARVWL
jgi:hypothetical protein